MRSYVDFAIRFRWPILAALVVMSGVAGFQISRGVVASSVGGLFLGEHPDYPRYLERVEAFGSDDVIIISFAEPALLTARQLQRLEKAVERIRELPHVEKVTSVLDAQRIEGALEGVSVQRYADAARQSPRRRMDLLADLLRDPFAQGLLVSSRGEHTSVVVELAAATERPAENTPQILAAIRAAFVAAGYAGESLHVTGLSAAVGAVMEQTELNIRRLFPFVALMLLVTVWLMFRRFWPVLITALVTLVAAVWTMGFAVLLDRHISIFTGMVPAIVLIIAFSDVVHLCSAYLLELGQGHDKREAILRSCSEVGAACLFTSITTFFGFISLATVPTPVSRILGLALGFGAGVALLLALTLTPVILWLLPPPSPWRRGTTGRVQDRLDDVLWAIGNLCRRWPRSMVAIFAVVAALGVSGALRLTIETDFSRRMADDHPLQIDRRYFQRHFSGANTVDLLLATPEVEGFLDPERFASVAAFHEEVNALAEVGRVYSLVSLVAKLWGAMTYGDPAAHRLPDTRAGLAQCLLLFEAAGGEDLSRWVDFERRTLRMTLWLPDEEFRRTAITTRRALRLAKERLPAEIEASPFGLVYLLGNGFDEILDGQRRALLLVFGAIALMMMIGLRSIRVGLWSMVPNLLPLFALAGYAGWVWDYVDSDILIVAIIAIGIGVDDTIHFLMRFRIESARAESPAAAIRRTFYYSGRGIVITSAILVLGFSPFALSDYFSVQVLGTMLPLTLIVALAADLFLVPALAQLGLVTFRRPPG